MDGSHRASYVAVAETVFFHLMANIENIRGHGALTFPYQSLAVISAFCASYNNVVATEQFRRQRLSSAEKRVMTVPRASAYFFFSAVVGNNLPGAAVDLWHGISSNASNLPVNEQPIRPQDNTLYLRPGIDGSIRVTRSLPNRSKASNG